MICWLKRRSCGRGFPPPPESSGRRTRVLRAALPPLLALPHLSGRACPRPLPFAAFDGNGAEAKGPLKSTIASSQVSSQREKTAARGTRLLERSPPKQSDTSTKPAWDHLAPTCHAGSICR